MVWMPKLKTSCLQHQASSPAASALKLQRLFCASLHFLTDQNWVGRTLDVQVMLYINYSCTKSFYLPLFGLISFSVVLSLIPSSLGTLNDICEPMKQKKE